MNEHAVHAREALDKAQKVVLTTHVNPDGDAIGSVMGLRSILQGQGAIVDVILPSAAPVNLQWIPGTADAHVWKDVPMQRALLEQADVIAVLDLNDLERLGSLGQAIAQCTSTVVNIDHHTHPKDFASVQWIDTNAPAVCAMLVDLYHDVPLNADAANSLYAGLMTDTGSFRFPRTTAHTFQQASRLLASGADPVAAYEQIMNQNSFTRQQLLGSSLRGMTLHHEGRLCIMTVRQEDFASTTTTVEDTEGFVHHTLSIEGVQMGVLCIELPDEIKCSFRSKGGVYVRDLAAEYGGGGHVYAAGARMKGITLSTAVNGIILKAVTALSEASS